MDLPNDPNDRRRLGPEDMRNRDAEVAGLRRAGVPFRTIAGRLNMSLSAVQKAVRRHHKLAEALSTGEPGNVVSIIADDELTAEDVTTIDDVGRIGALERHRLRYYEPGSPQHVALAGWLASHPPVVVSSGPARR